MRHQLQQIVRLDRQGNEIGRAQAHGQHRLVDPGIGAHHDQRRLTGGAP